MKKTISINIAGLVFYIEEDGYDKLRQYIGSVHRYFSAFDDSAEIVADIEGRIAERFLLKQKSENKQAISVEDVSELIIAMGSVSDFEAAEQAEDLISEPLLAARPAAQPGSGAGVDSGRVPHQSQPPKRRMFRDLKRKILGGVAAGVAHYYVMDPLWVRLLLLLGIFGLVPLSGISGMNLEENFAFLSGFLIISYIAMWIAFPGSVELEDNTKIKKFYRDPQKKVLGGVASGLGSYFNIDIGIVRFIWVISIFFFGTGILAYIILWAIAPAANTLTEKMEMQGEPITLSNIESNIKRNLNLGMERAKGSEWKDLLLLPFKLIGTILNALGRVLRELGPVVRVLIGIFMVGIAVVGILTLVVCGGALLGMAHMPDFGILPAEFLILKETPVLLILSGATLLIVPVLVILFLGLMLLLKRRVVGSTVWVVLAGLTVFSMIGAISSGLIFQRNFVEEGESSQLSGYKLANGTLLLDQEERNSNQNIDVRVTLKGSSQKDSMVIEKRFLARGSTRSDAREMASQIVYDVEQVDSSFYFPNGPLIAETLPYRNQHIEIVVEIPFNRPFAMKSRFYFGFLNRDHNTRKNLGKFDIHHRDLDWDMLRWTFVPDSGLVCLNFPAKFMYPEEENKETVESWSGDDADFETVELGNRGEFVKQFAVAEFKGIALGGAFQVLVKKGEKSTVTIDGTEANVEALAVQVEEGILRIEKLAKDADFPEPGKRIGVIISMPDLEFIESSGTGRLKVEGFENLKHLTLRLSGATMTELSLNADRLDVDLTGASKMILRGNISDIKADLSGTCLLKASDSQVKNAEIKVSGVSKAYLGSVEKLDKRETGESAVYKRGEY